MKFLHTILFFFLLVAVVHCCSEWFSNLKAKMHSAKNKISDKFRKKSSHDEPMTKQDKPDMKPEGEEKPEIKGDEKPEAKSDEKPETKSEEAKPENEKAEVKENKPKADEKASGKAMDGKPAEKTKDKPTVISSMAEPLTNSAQPTASASA